MKSIWDELTDYRLKVERDGKEIVNVPGILALPGVLIAPKLSLFGTVAASVLGCNIHLENGEGRDVNVSEKLRKAANTVADTAKETAKAIREEVDKAWQEVSADDPSSAEDDAPADAEDAPEDAAEANREILDDLKKHAEDDIPTIHVDKEDPRE